MGKQLRILHIEDSPADAGLIERQLMKAGLDFIIRIIETKEDFIHSLEKFKPDLILSDHSLPQFNSMEALAIFNSMDVDVPFILVTGSVSEEFAIRAIKEGADDYILKNNLIRLPSAVNQALKTRNMEAERRKASRELEETNRELNTFIYKAAHDLRGPLCSIMGLTNVAMMEGVKENVPDYLRKISESTQKLDDVLLALIDLMSIRDTQPMIKELDVKATLDSIFSELSNTEGFNQVKFSISAGNTPGFFSDERIIRMALLNLIENTIHYRRNENAVTHIRSEFLEDAIKIEIEDNGIGIDPEMLQHIFDMYFRGSQISIGSGLGLYVAQKGIKRLGGAIEVRSKLAQGSVFTIYLPGQAVLMQ